MSHRPTWSESITDWQAATFGPVTPERAWARFEEEFDELHFRDEDSSSDAVADEAADVVITFAAWVKARTGLDLADAVERKMAINRAREWKLDGAGCGYHVKGPK